MKKTKQIHKKNPVSISPEQTIQFLQEYAQVIAGQDLKTKLISLRVPENILNVFKKKAEHNHQKYQTMIVHLMREWIRKDSSPERENR